VPLTIRLVKVLFVYENVYAVGGIQTWLRRMIPRLRADGHEVALLTRAPTMAGDVTTETVDALADLASIHVARPRWFRARGPIDPPLDDADVVFACNLEGLLAAGFVQRRFMPGAKVVAGVFHPREYCANVPPLERRWGLHLGVRILRRLPVENMMFITEGTTRQTSDCLGRDLTGAPVLPIPVDTDALRPAFPRAVDRTKIASVARLAGQYAHHRQMIRVIGELRDDPRGFTYQVYGDGPSRPELEAEVREQRLEDRVFFHGAIPYERFAMAVGDAFAFVGSGTALLEAAACGVPALLTIAGESEPLTHGFIHEAEGDELGGWLPGHPKRPMAERLLWLADRDAREYAEVERAARARAEQFSVSRLAPRFAALLERAVPFSIPIAPRHGLIGRADWVLEALLAQVGRGDGWTQRYIRDLPV
jgi:glycosyltransferase involved in cell wall biosynthesis